MAKGPRLSMQRGQCLHCLRYTWGQAPHNTQRFRKDIRHLQDNVSRSMTLLRQAILVGSKAICQTVHELSVSNMTATVIGIVDQPARTWVHGCYEDKFMSPPRIHAGPALGIARCSYHCLFPHDRGLQATQSISRCCIAIEWVGLPDSGVAMSNPAA